MAPRGDGRLDARRRARPACRYGWSIRTAPSSAPPIPHCRPWTSIARRALPPASAGRTDRVRRVVHGGRVELRRPGRPAQRPSRYLDCRPRSPCAAMASAAGGGAAPAVRCINSLNAGARQHRRALRPVQRPVRRVPRRDDDVLERAVRGMPASRVVRAAGLRSTARSTACSTPRASVPAAGSSRSARAGANCASVPRPRGARSHSITLSAEQQHLAQERVAAAGLSDRVDIELKDYREVEGRYDAVVSVEMIEAVGYRFWPTYFATLDRLVSPGGRVAIQAITMPHDRMLAIPQHLYLDPEVHLPRRADPLGRGDRRRSPSGETRLRTVGMLLAAAALRRDAAAVAGALRRTPRRGVGLGVRRRLPTDVGAVPGVLRGRIPVGLPRRLPVDLRPDGVAE